MKNYIPYHDLFLACISFFTASLFSFSLAYSQAFPCDGKLYFGSDGTPCGISSIEGYTTGTPTVTLVCAITSGSMNALGANPIDRMLYFSGQGGIRRIDANCNDVLVCPGINSSSGCFDNAGRYWIPGGGGILGYDLVTCTVAKTITYSVSVPGPDLMFNPCDNKFYWCDATTMMSMDTNGVINTYTVGFGGSGNFGGVAIGLDGNLYGMPNGTSDLYMFNTTNIISSGIVASTGTVTTCGHDMASFPCGTLVPGFSSSVLCGNAVQFTDTTQGWVVSWQWNFGDGSMDTVNNNPTHVFSGPGTYTVSLYVSAGPACLGIPQATYSVIVTVPPSFSVTVTSPVTICPGSGATLAASGGTSYSWSTGATSSSVTVSPSASTTYSVIAVNAGGCTDTASVTVTVNASPVIIITGPDTVCSGQLDSLFASGGVTYNWSTGDTNDTILIAPSVTTSYSLVAADANGCTNTASFTVMASPNIVATVNSSAICSGDSALLTAAGGGAYSWSTGSTSSSLIVYPTATTSYTVTVTNGFCSATAVATVTVTTNLTAGITGPSSVCAGSTVTLNATGGSAFSWSTGSTSASITLTPSSTVNYTVLVTDPNGCSDTAVATLTVSPPPSATISGNATICAGEIVTLSAGGGGSYSWSNGSSGSAITVSPPSTTNYSVVVSVGSCADTAAAIVTVSNNPVANAGPDVSIIQGSSTTLNATGGGTYNWSPAAGLSCTNCASPVADPLATTQYCVFVSDASGCGDSACVTVYVDDIGCDPVYLPNAFSPNGDNENDMLYLYGECIEEMRLIIYARWGEKVYEGTDPAKGWDGMYGGKSEDTAVFTFYLSYRLKSGEKGEKKGNISLLK